MGMGIDDSDLFPTETVLLSKLANLWIKPSKHGLSRFAFNEYIGDNEALGGKAYLTNYRILFKSHGFNRMVGVESMFLSNVVQIHQKLIGITVESTSQTYEMVMWFNGGFVSEARKRISELGPAETEKLKELIAEHPERLGALQKHNPIESINNIISGSIDPKKGLSDLSGLQKRTFKELLALFLPKSS